ncbi:hypothetical protein [Streptomyces nigra]|uniref:DUF1097 domain-containing protein n=1 Tax=Streptomyces nigra TaxID=1827580 RepID=A0ABZ1IWE6_9ACTN
MSLFLVVLAGAAALFLFGLSRVPPGIKVTVLTAPPVAAVMWLLDVVFGRRAVAVAVGAVFLVVLVALNGLLAHPRLPPWAKPVVFGTVPGAALAWLLVVTADDTLKDPGEDPCSMYHGGTGVSEVFPPRAYCRFGDGGTLDLAPGTQVVFWVCFTVSVVLLALGLAWAVRDPRAVVRRFHRAGRG